MTAQKQRPIHILVVNAALGGASGNTAAYLIPFAKAMAQIEKEYSLHAQTRVLHLADKPNFSAVVDSLRWADVLIFATGTYWDSWSSLMQQFLESVTEFEAGPEFLGKPAGVIVTMHSVGGKGVMSRLQGVLNTFGVAIPPMSGVCLSLQGELAQENDNEFHDDFFSIKDFQIMIQNILACNQRNHLYLEGGQLRKENRESLIPFAAWEVDRGDATRVWAKPN